ncbi:MAG: DUF6049 family protein [Leucobacter sp.]
MSREPLGIRSAVSGRRFARALAVLAGTVAMVAAAALAAGAAFAVPPATPGSVRAETGDGAAGDTAEDDGTGAELLIAAQDPVVLAGSGELRFDLVIRNPGEDPVPAGTVVLSLDPQRVADRAQLLGDATEAEPRGPAGEEADESDEAGARPPVGIVEISAAETSAGGEQRLSVVVPVDELPLAASDEPGVYEVIAQLRAEDPAATPAAETAEPLLSGAAPIVWQGAGASASLTLVVPMVLPGSVATMPTPAEIAEIVPRLDRLLTAAETARATLAIDPRIIAGIRAYGLEVQASARQFLGRLAASELPMFLLQFADADPAAQAALGFEQLLQPNGLSFVTQWGRFDETTAQADAGAEGARTGGPVDENAAEGSPAEPDAEETGAEDTSTEDTSAEETTPGEDADPTAAPSLEQLLAWPQGYAGAWPAAGEVDSGTLELLRASGMTSVLLESGNVTVRGGTRFALGGLDAMVADAALGDAARRALGSADEIERSIARADLAALTALVAQSQLPGAVLALDRGTVAESENPEQLLDWITALDWVDAAEESLQAEGTGALVSGGTAENRRELLRQDVKRSVDIVALAPLLLHPDYLDEYQRVRLLAAFATRDAAPEVDFTAVSEVRRERDEEFLRGVQVVTTANTQLVGTSSQIPVQLHNSLPFEALVTLRIAPMSAGVAVPERLFEEQSIAAGGNATVLIPVRSRVSSGESALLAQVTDTAGERVFSSATLQLTIRSAFETILLWGLGVFALLLLGFGIWRSVRRRRRQPAE